MAPRSPPLNAGALTADACRDWLAKAAPDSTLSSMLTATYRLQSLLAGADRSSRFAVGLTLQTHTLTVVLPDLVERTIASRQPPVDALLRHHWTERGSELRRKLQTAVGHILQVSFQQRFFFLFLVLGLCFVCDNSQEDLVFKSIR